MSSGSEKKEPRYVCLSEAKASQLHKMCAEVSTSVPHFLQVGLSLSLITCRCLLRVCPVSRPITALVCVLLKDSSRAPVARSVPEISSRSCLCALQWPRHLTYPYLCEFSNYRLSCTVHSYVPEDQVQDKVAPTRNGIYISSSTHVYTRESSWNPSSNTL